LITWKEQKVRLIAALNGFLYLEEKRKEINKTTQKPYALRPTKTSLFYSFLNFLISSY
jgi:hypothetical protein